VERALAAASEDVITLKAQVKNKRKKYTANEIQNKNERIYKLNENIHTLQDLFEKQEEEVKADRRKGHHAEKANDDDIEGFGFGSVKPEGKKRGSFEGFGDD